METSAPATLTDTTSDTLPGNAPTDAADIQDGNSMELHDSMRTALADPQIVHLLHELADEYFLQYQAMMGVLTDVLQNVAPEADITLHAIEDRVRTAVAICCENDVIAQYGYYKVNVYGTDAVLDSRFPIRHAADALENPAVPDDVGDTAALESEAAAFHVKLMKLQHLYGGNLPLSLSQRYGIDLMHTFIHAPANLREAMVRAVDADRELNEWRLPDADTAESTLPLAKSA